MFSRPRTLLRTSLILALVFALALPVGACGRKGKPEPPPGSDYPRQYPTR